MYRRLQDAGVSPIQKDTGRDDSYLVLPESTIRDEQWKTLWESRAADEIFPAFGNRVLPQCPLLSNELADTVVESCGIQAPAGSAWVCMQVDLHRFVGRGRAIDEEHLQRALETCVDVGEALHDQLAWLSPDLEHDAWLNRRLGIVLCGLGDTVSACGLDPGDHTSLRFMNQLLLRVRRALHLRSTELALQHGPIPAITLSDPSHELPRGGIRDDWRRRWRDAANASQVRHRNLLVISPWSLFPTARYADYRYAELLPLLRHADACAFRRNVSIAHWNFNEFKRFHQRARAVLQQRGDSSQFAYTL